MPPDGNFHQQVAVRAAAHAHAAFAPDTDALSGIHACRDLHLDPVGLAHLALAAAGGAGILDDLAPAAAGGAGGGGLHLHAHEVLHGTHLTGAVALAARLDHAVGAARTLTVGAVLNPLGSNLFFAAEGRFLEGQLQPRHDVLAPAGRILLGATAAAAAEEFAENVSQVAEAVKPAESGTAKACAAVASAARAEVGVNSGKTVLVVPRALVSVGQDFVGFPGLLEFFLGSLVAGVTVGVVLHGGLAVGLLYVVGAGILADAQHLIVISFCICHTQFTSLSGISHSELPQLTVDS